MRRPNRNADSGTEIGRTAGFNHLAQQPCLAENLASQDRNSRDTVSTTSGARVIHRHVSR
jgi:hypothetical protein